MDEQSRIKKSAWEYRAYEFWNKRDGPSEEKAKEIKNNPRVNLKNIKPILMN